MVASTRDMPLTMRGCCCKTTRARALARGSCMDRILSLRDAFVPHSNQRRELAVATEARHRERRGCFFELAVYCRQRVRERGAHNSTRHDSHKRSNLPTKIFPRCLLLDISTIPLPTLCWQQTLFLQTLVRVLCRITHRYSHSSSELLCLYVENRNRNGAHCSQ